MKNGRCRQRAGALDVDRLAASVDWARAALDAGYTDQSHMIAEFREFSG